MLDNVKVVLVGTSHSGNIGSAARAMKVMGLSNLVLVDPQCEMISKQCQCHQVRLIYLRAHLLLAVSPKLFRTVVWLSVLAHVHALWSGRC